MAVIGANYQRQVTGGNRAECRGRVGVAGLKPSLATPASVVTLDPGVEQADLDAPSFYRDRPVPREPDGVQVGHEMVVAVVRVMFAVVNAPDDLPLYEQV